jgi:hypothetical protein
MSTAAKSFIVYARQRKQNGTLNTLIIDLKNQLTSEEMTYGAKQVPTQSELEVAQKIENGTFTED